MNRLSPEAARLFQLAKHADNPDAAQLDRVGRALSRRIAHGGAALTGTAFLSHSARAAMGMSVSKIFTAIAVIGALSSTCFFVVHSRKRPSSNAASVVASSLEVAREQPAIVASARPGEPATLASDSSLSPNIKRSIPPRPVRVAAAVPTPEPADQLQAETADLRQAQAALRAGDSASALRLLNAQDAKYGTGLLQQERAAARVLALCQSGSVKAARAESARFEMRWPNSPLASRVHSACAASGEP